jgi:hypothetical protein
MPNICMFGSTDTTSIHAYRGHDVTLLSLALQLEPVNSRDQEMPLNDVL